MIVNRSDKTVDVEWRIQFDDGGVKGKPNNDTPSYDKLVEYALKGISHYWSRSIDTSKGSYQINVKPISTSVLSTPSMTLQVTMKKGRGGYVAERSVNASCASGVGFYRGVGDFFSDTTRTWYLQGDYGLYAEVDFKRTVAHEMGHAVLATYAYKDNGPNNYSWVHKGSSGKFPTLPIPNEGEKGYETSPSKNADLMKYYSGGSSRVC